MIASETFGGAFIPGLPLYILLYLMPMFSAPAAFLCNDDALLFQKKGFGLVPGWATKIWKIVFSRPRNAWSRKDNIISPCHVVCFVNQFIYV
jgi:hypothetical protein